MSGGPNKMISKPTCKREDFFLFGNYFQFKPECCFVAHVKQSLEEVIHSFRFRFLRCWYGPCRKSLLK